MDQRKSAKTDGLESEDLPLWTRISIGRIWEEVLEAVEAGNAYTKSFLWKSTEFLRHVVTEKEGRVAITFPYVCENCKFLPAEDILWWASASHCEEKEKQREWTDGDVVLAECHLMGGSRTARSRFKLETQRTR